MTTIRIQFAGDIGEADAIAAMEEMGFHGGAADRTGAVEDLHGHDFDIVARVLSGEAVNELADGTIVSAGPGIVVPIPRGTVHQDVPGTAYRAVLDFSCPPSEMTPPIDRPVDQLPA